MRNVHKYLSPESGWEVVLHSLPVPLPPTSLRHTRHLLVIITPLSVFVKSSINSKFLEDSLTGPQDFRQTEFTLHSQIIVPMHRITGKDFTLASTPEKIQRVLSAIGSSTVGWLSTVGVRQRGRESILSIFFFHGGLSWNNHPSPRCSRQWSALINGGRAGQEAGRIWLREETREKGERGEFVVPRVRGSMYRSFRRPSIPYSLGTRQGEGKKALG